MPKVTIFRSGMQIITDEETAFVRMKSIVGIIKSKTKKGKPLLKVYVENDKLTYSFIDHPEIDSIYSKLMSILNV